MMTIGAAADLDIEQLIPTVVVEDDREEIRFALAMNGGVSLAVWMGGVTRELDRLRRQEGAYAEVLTLLQSVVRIDVIAGASAGGLNGALLALAIASGSDTAGVRDLWLDRGSFELMIRDPFEKDPPSLLRGDEFFLPELYGAFTDIRKSGNPLPDFDPLDLQITATLLSGEVRPFPDSFGSIIADTDHRARFHFRRDPESGHDDFQPDAVVAQLALAARTSASFPAAFEPSFVPIGSTPQAERPDMKDIASFTSSRWAIDGGVLVNTPVQPMLEAIVGLSAKRQVRRIAAIIVPSPREYDPGSPDDPETMPKILEVAAASLSGLPRQQSIGDQLAAIAAHNRLVDQQRRRYAVLAELDTKRLGRLAAQLLGPYVKTRRAEAADYIMRRLTDALPRHVEGEAQLEVLQQPVWNADPVRAALGGRADVPWLPIQLVQKPHRSLPLSDERGWIWGLSALERIHVVASDVLRQGLAVLPLSLENERRTLRDLRESLYRAIRVVRELREIDRSFWEDELAEVLKTGLRPEQLDSWAAAAEARWRERISLATLLQLALAVGGIVARAGAVLANTRSKAPDRQGRIDDILATIGLPRGKKSILRRMLAVEVVERTLGPAERGPQQRIEVLQLSANTPNAFDARAKVDEKLTGLQIEHFGAFYKSSWRANDWLWGRLDGSMRIVQVLLAPLRLRTLGFSAQQAALAIEAIALGASDAGSRRELTLRWDRARAEVELGFLDDAGTQVPRSLPYCTEAVARRLQLEALREELPVVARAVMDDFSRGGENVPATKWARGLVGDGELEAAKAIDVFRQNRIGLERLTGEAGSDLFTRVTTKAAATAGSALHGKNSGLFRPLRRGAAAVRGVLLPMYLLARGALARSPLVRFLTLLVLATAGAVLAVRVETNGAVFAGLTTVAVVVLIAGFLLALIRSGLVAVLLLVALGLLAIGVCLYVHWGDESAWDACFGWLPDLAPALPILGIVLVAMLFGVLHKPRWLSRLRKPRWLSRLRNRRG